MTDLRAILESCTARHSRLCPRQVLGVRMGLAGAAALKLEVPRRDKRMLVIAETDGCFVSGVKAATGCSDGGRTLRVEDYGKVGATFIHVKTGAAVRLAPKPNIRQRALLYAPEQERRYYAQLYGYQRMPDVELFDLYQVALITPVKDLVSRPGVRVNCDLCGEEIINQRQKICGDQILCLPCTGSTYYRIDKISYILPVSVHQTDEVPASNESEIHKISMFTET